VPQFSQGSGYGILVQAGASISWNEVKECEWPESGEIGVERDDPGPGGAGERGQPCIRPAMRGKSRLAGPCLESGFGGGGFLQKHDFRQRGESAPCLPCFSRRPWGTTHHLSVCQQTEQAQHGNPAEGDPWSGLILPIAAGAGMVCVVRIRECEPDIEVREIKGAHCNLPL
jgi:hypothetical protein